jgi:hypothetical protein
MSSALLLASENEKLRIENQRQKRKRAKNHTYIARGVFYQEQKGPLVRKLANRGNRGQQRQRPSDRSEHHATAACVIQQNTRRVCALHGRQLVSR